MNNILYPYKISEINLKNIIYTKKKKSKNKTVIYIGYKDRKRVNKFVFQTCSFLNINKPIKKFAIAGQITNE